MKTPEYEVRITDQELITQMRQCAFNQICDNCEFRRFDMGAAECINKIISEAADRIEQLVALAQNGQSANDTNMRLSETIQSLQAERDCYKVQYDAAIEDMEALMWHSGDGCIICANSVKDTPTAGQRWTKRRAQHD